ncbi:MAG: M20/M25/M40 family metallo-hydrolase [Vicinamibacterales bacterium]
MKRRVFAAVGLVCLAAGVVLAQSGVDTAMFAKIRTEGLEHSQVDAMFDTLTVDIGPRLTASPAHKRAAEWARERLASFGLTNAHLEPWKFGRGWDAQRVVVEMIEPRYLPIIAYADGWSESTAGELSGAPVLAGDKSPEQLEALKGSLKGAIVLTQPLFDNFVRKDRPNPSDVNYQPNGAAYATSVGRPANAPRPQGETPAQRVARIYREAGAGVLIKPSIGEHGTVFVTGRDGGPGAVPSLTIASEQYNMMLRLAQRGIPVKLRVNVQTKFYDSDNGNAYNVIAELPGTDPVLKDEVVMIGGHIDSWHTGVGATDNADGTTTMMEAMRILKSVGAQPRRTIRVALWGGEEQGLLGSAAWVQQHLAGDANKATRDKFDVYFNIDNGFGPIYGFYLENNQANVPVFDRWLEPLKAVGIRRNTIEGVGSTDHLSFIAAGVPGFNPIQRYDNYDIRTHHSNMDTVERLDAKEIRQAAVVMAWVALQAANDTAKVPRITR